MAQPSERKGGGEKKRKLQADTSEQARPPKKGNDAPNKKQKTGPNQPHFRNKQRDARVLATQTTGTAFQNGALDVSAFVSAREFEIRALEQGMQRSKKANNRRAFQQVPRELRRRTAAHDVRRIPKRLRDRGRKEMREDNTPGPGGVGKRIKKVNRRARLRDETVKKLRALGAKQKAEREKQEGGKTQVLKKNTDLDAVVNVEDMPTAGSTIQTRNSKVKKASSLASPPTPKAKFRRRQKNKSWLPTHLFHAKRAHMTPPSDPLWRFAIPLTPTQKSYRPTHRASRERGAVAWDASYMATIALAGRESSLKSVFRGLGIGVTGKGGEEWAWAAKGERWRNGKRVLETWVFERESGKMIAPVAIIWCGLEGGAQSTELVSRTTLVRIHPSAFHQVWEELVRLVKVAKPEVKIEDLRFEIGSIEVVGPGATEALLGTLWPHHAIDKFDGKGSDQQSDIAATTWTSLNGLTDTSALPAGALLGFNIQDPRLHHPPRTSRLPQTEDEQNKLLASLAAWPLDMSSSTASALFDAAARNRACKLPSQKAINRRKTLAPPGVYPGLLPTDPAIPIILHVSSSCTSNGWTLLAPWKTIQPIWYGLMCYPLSTGGQPRFGGLNEQRQLAFEVGRSWYPSDAPGTKAGWTWEMSERKKRLDEWNMRPKGKRIAWEKVEANYDGKGGRGEVSDGWACGWELLLELDKPRSKAVENAEPEANTQAQAKQSKTASASKHDHGKASTTTPAAASKPTQTISKPETLIQLSHGQAEAFLRSQGSVPAPQSALHGITGKLMTVKLTLLTRGVPQSCARIYRLPHPTSSNERLRAAWLQLLPGKQQKKKDKSALPPRLRDTASSEQLQRRLAQELISGNEAASVGNTHPSCPPQEDLIGFVTAGNYNLAEGKATGIGSLAIWRLGDISGMGKEGRLCVVRNAGDGIGRLARWEVV